MALPKQGRSAGVSHFPPKPTLPTVHERDTQNEDNVSGESDNNSDTNDNNSDNNDNGDEDSSSSSNSNSDDNADNADLASNDHGDSDDVNSTGHSTNGSKNGNREQQGRLPNKASYHQHNDEEHIHARNHNWRTACNRDEKANNLSGEPDSLATTFNINPYTPSTTCKTNITTTPSPGKAASPDNDSNTCKSLYIIYV